MKFHVANAPGEDYDPNVPFGYTSWIDYWNKLNNKNAKICRNCGKKTDDLYGGHIEICEEGRDQKWYHKKEKGVFITPICSECNNPNNTNVFEVDEGDLISEP